MRPQSMRIFDWLFVGSVGIGLVNLIVALNDGALASNHRATMIAGTIFGAIIALTLWYLISRLRISFFRWILLALTLVGIVSLRDLLFGGVGVADIIGLVATAMQIAAVALLFRADAREWLAAP